MRTRDPRGRHGRPEGGAGGGVTSPPGQRTRWAALLGLWLVGCGPAGVSMEDTAMGPAGPTGPTGPGGLTGPAGPTSAAYRWHDATGAQVTEGPELLAWFGEVLWALDVETAQAYPAESAEIYYQDEQCDGPGVLVGAPPGFAVSVEGWIPDVGVEPLILARPADAAAQEFCSLRSRSAGAGCELGLDDCATGIALEDAQDLLLPETPWFGPLHPEPID